MNEYLCAANTFINWLKRSKRLSTENPSKYIEKNFNSSASRPMSADLSPMKKLRRLIAVSAYRSVKEQPAGILAYGGRNFAPYVWADVFLDSPNPHIVVQAKNAKNRKLQPLPLHPEVVAALKSSRKRGVRHERIGSFTASFRREKPSAMT